MRFYPDGPSLPSTLLAATDAGRTVFVCGAGVSLAKAGLPTFQGLLDGVLETLHPAPDGPAGRLLAAEAEIRAADPPIHMPPGFGGLATADRTFGELEAEFPVATVERAVAERLLTSMGVDLSAHRTVVRLASGGGGGPRVVTTNFDRLFEMAMPTAPVHLPPRLPTEIDGLVKLHGSIDPSGRAEEGGFVLSTASFGAAYLADGWAARFMRDLLERHTVVFLGYSAEDPPMQYLLEGMRRAGAPTGRAYAFHPGDDGGRWAAKGVTALSYDSSTGHEPLWDTLEAWAARVADPAGWRGGIADRARRGPRQLEPHERGQVADLLASQEGSTAFFEAAPPAEWVCVLDPAIRFGPPGREAPPQYGPGATNIDPLRLYGLDDDPDVPLDHSQSWPKREAPSDVWNAFAWTEADRVDVLQQMTTTSPSSLSRQDATLPPRLLTIEAWLAKVAAEPASLWWWARQRAPRARFRWMMRPELDRTERPGDAWVAWETLFESWDAASTPPRFDDPNLAVHDFRSTIAGTGWTDAAIRRFEDMGRPRLRVQSSSSAAPPPREAGVSRRRMFSTTIDYRDDFWGIDCPDEWVRPVVEALGRNLVRLGILLAERGGQSALSSLPPFVRPDADGSAYEYAHDLGAAVFGYCAMLERLRSLDRTAFDRHVTAWPDGPFRPRLQLWLALDPERLGGSTAAAVLTEMPDELFWHPRIERDLLHAIRDRWDDLPEAAQEHLAERLRAGPSDETLHWADRDQRPEIRAWVRLQAVGWLTREGIALPLDWSACREQWRRDVSDWTEETVSEAINPLVGRGGIVETRTDHAVLDGVPIEQIVSVALENSGRTDDFLVETDPFSGLARADLDRACDAIRRSTANAEEKGKALGKLLAAAVEAKHPVGPALDLLRDCQDDVLYHEPGAIGFWLRSMSNDADAVLAMNSFLDRFIGLLADIPWPSDADPDWVFRAINAPAGQVMDAMMCDPRMPDAAGGALPADWQARAEAMLRLPHPHGAYALTILGGQAPYLHHHAPAWVEAHVLRDLDGVRGDALLAGLMRGNRPFSAALFDKVGPILVDAALKAQEGGRAGRLASQLLLAWQRTDGSLDDETIRDVLRRGSEAFRLTTIREAGRLLTDEDDLSRFLHTVWPRQAALQTDRMVMALADLALAGRARDAIDPHLRRLAAWPHLHLLRKLDKAASAHPAETLAILDRIIPDAPADHVYGATDMLDTLASADPNLGADPRLLRLRRMIE